jgi:hypothetical protein
MTYRSTEFMLSLRNETNAFGLLTLKQGLVHAETHALARTDTSTAACLHVHPYISDWASGHIHPHSYLRTTSKITSRTEAYGRHCTESVASTDKRRE